jgi:hypothetical protein
MLGQQVQRSGHRLPHLIIAAAGVLLQGCCATGSLDPCHSAGAAADQAAERISRTPEHVLAVAGAQELHEAWDAARSCHGQSIVGAVRR